MKRSRPWLRGLALGLCVEACLWLFTTCRPFSDWQKRYSSNQSLLYEGGGAIYLADDSPRRISSEPGSESPTADRHLYEALQKLLADRQPAPHARLTREGQLIDEQGRLLLNKLDEWEKFAYSPELDILVWTGTGSDGSQGLNIRNGDKVKWRETWMAESVHIDSKGQIWLQESWLPWSAGNSVLDADGNFLGWRIRSSDLTISRYCELTATDLAQVEAARKKHDEEEG